MRRPVTISGMLVHLARAYVARSPRVVGAIALGFVGATSVGLVATRGACPSQHSSHAGIASRVLARAQIAGGACAASGVFCVSDVTCGRGDRCVDPRGVMGLVARASDPGVRDDELPISPSVVWNGEGWAVAWSAIDEENAEIYFARTTATGQRIGAPIRLTRGASLKVLPSLAASSDGYAVTWTDVGEDVTAWVLRLDKAGNARGAPTKVSPQQGLDLASRVVWNGHDYALAWYHASSASDLSVRFARIGLDGGRVGEEKAVAERVIPTGLFDFRSMGDGYGLGWSAQGARGGNGQTLFARIGAGGEPSQPLRVAQAQDQNGTVALSWQGAHFGMVWEDALSLDEDDTPLSRLAFAGVTPSTIAVPRRELTPRDAYFTQATLAWGGTQYGLTYARIGGDGADVFFNRLDAQGAPSRSPIRFTAGALGLFPSMAWSGREFGVAWTHIGARGIQLHFARVNSEGKRVGDDVAIASSR